MEPRTWRAVAYAAGVALVAWVLFLITLAPTVTAEDSGELIAAAWHFGIPHPPGYPVWTVLCGLFIRVVAIGEIAWRANLFSAVCSAAAAGVAFSAMRQLGLTRGAATATALVWIWSKWSWSQSVITEVYGLNSLLIAGVLWGVARWYRTGRHRPLLLASLLLGLGMAHHHSIAFVGLALLVWAVAIRPRLVVQWRLGLACIGLLAVGLLPYAYLPVRAAADPAMNWDNPSTLRKAWAHATRQSYGTFGATQSGGTRSWGRWGGQLAYMARSVCDDVTPWLTVPAMLGLVLLTRRNRRMLLLILLWLLCTGPLFVGMANFDLDRSMRWLARVFFIPASLGLAISLGFVVDWLREASARRLKRPGAVALAVALVSAGPLVQVISHWDRCNYANYHYAYDHARNLLACMEQDALVFPYSDFNAFPLVYLLMVEQRRPDVLIGAYSGSVRRDLIKNRPADDRGSRAAWLIRQERRPTYCTVEMPPPLPNTEWVRAGLTYRLKAVGAPFDGSGLLADCDYRNLRVPTVRDLSATLILCHYHLFAGRDELDRGARDVGLEHLRQAGRLGEGLKGVLHKAGAFLAEHGETEEAIAFCKQAIDEDPKYLGPRWSLFDAYRKAERWSEAREVVEAIMDVAPGDAQSRAQMGFLLFHQFNDREGAVHYWREALKRDPRLPGIREMLDRIEGR